MGPRPEPETPQLSEPSGPVLQVLGRHHRNPKPETQARLRAECCQANGGLARGSKIYRCSYEVVVKQLNLSYLNKETILFTIHPLHGNLNETA